MHDPHSAITITHERRAYTFQGGAWRLDDAPAGTDQRTIMNDLWSLAHATPSARRHDTARQIVADTLATLEWEDARIASEAIRHPSPLEAGAFA